MSRTALAAGSERREPWASAQRLMCQKTLFNSLKLGGIVETDPEAG